MKSMPTFSTLASSIVVGDIYEHYKGMRYKIVAIAHHSETVEELVIYQALYAEGGVWARPLGMFLEEVVIDGKTMPRFRLIHGS